MHQQFLSRVIYHHLLGCVIGVIRRGGIIGRADFLGLSNAVFVYVLFVMLLLIFYPHEKVLVYVFYPPPMILLYPYVFSIDGIDLHMGPLICVIFFKDIMICLGVFATCKVLAICILQPNKLMAYYHSLCA